MGFPATNAGQDLDAANDVQIVKDSLSGSGIQAITTIAGTALLPGLRIGDADTGFTRSSLNRLDMVMGVGVTPARWAPKGLMLGSAANLADARTYLDVKDPFAGWTDTVVDARYSTLFTLGSFNPSTLYQFHNDAPGNPPNNYLHGVLVAAVEVPSTARKGGTVDSLFKAAVVGVSRTSAPASSDPLGTLIFGLDAVGVYGSASALANTSQALAGNFLVDDRAGLSHAYLWGIEVDANIYSAPTRLFGVDVVADFYVAPQWSALTTNVGLDGNGAHAFRVGTVGSVYNSGTPANSKMWTYGLITMDGAALNGVVLGTLTPSTSTSSGSQPIVFRSRTTSTTFVSQIAAAQDGSLNYILGQTGAHHYWQNSAAGVLLSATDANVTAGVPFIAADNAAIAGSGKTLLFYGAGTPQPKQTVSGSKGGNAALSNLMILLDAMGLLTNGTS